MNPFKLFEDMFLDWQVKRLASSWFCADRLERRARMQVVTALVLELHEIKKVSTFATSIGNGVIEAVIEGDWERVADAASDFSFADESEDLRATYAPLWERFVTVARVAASDAKLRAAGTPTQPS